MGLDRPPSRTALLSVKNHRSLQSYGGDVNFKSSTSSGLTQTVQRPTRLPRRLLEQPVGISANP